MCRLVNDKIYSSTREGYGIFYEDELLDVLPESDRTRETLEAILKKLTKGGYADVKYAKGNVFCIMGLKVFESESEEVISVAAPSSAVRLPTAMLIAAFSLAFAGGALGSLIAGLIANAF